MAQFYVSKPGSKKQTKMHAVHKQGCVRLQAPDESVYLGEFLNCTSAVAAAKTLYSDANGCRECVPECHTPDK